MVHMFNWHVDHIRSFYYYQDNQVLEFTLVLAERKWIYYLGMITPRTILLSDYFWAELLIEL